MSHSLFRLGSVTMLALAVAVACSDDDATSPGAKGTLVVKLTDAPFMVDSADRVDVFVVRVDARLQAADSSDAAEGAPDDSASMGGWITVAVPEEMVNLLALQNGATLSIGDTSLTAGSYAALRLIIDPSRSSVTLKNGMVLSGTSNPNVSFPSAARSGLKIQLSQPVVVEADETTTVTVDFDLEDSFVMRGNSITQNGLLFKPVIRATIDQ